MNSIKERMINGLFKENPTFILMLGMCPTLAVTTSAINGIGMGLSTTVVLALSNLLISLLRNVIPDRVRMPAFIVVVASFVTMVQFLVQGFVPSLYASLGIYIPLIVVNCIILGRAESYASKNPPIPSLFDGIGMGLGFTMSITIIGLVREILGSGQAFGFQILPLADVSAGKAGFTPITIFVLAPGAFFILALLVSTMNVVRKKAEEKGRPLPPAQGCLADGCAGCGFAASCTGRSPVELTQAVDAKTRPEPKAAAPKAEEKAEAAEAKAEKPEAAAAEAKAEETVSEEKEGEE